MACSQSRNWTQDLGSGSDSPCVIAQKISGFSSCGSQVSSPTYTPSQVAYQRADGSNRCMCSAAYFYTISACAVCQNANQSDLPTWGQWKEHCSNPNFDVIQFDTDHIIPGYAQNTPPDGLKFSYTGDGTPPPPPPLSLPPPPPSSSSTSTPSATSTHSATSTDGVTSPAASASSSLTASSSTSPSASTSSSNSDTANDSTVTSQPHSRPAPLVTGAAGFSADPNNPNNPSPSLSTLGGSGNSANGIPDGRTKSNAGAIVGGIIGAIAFLILLGGIFYWYRSRRRRSSLAPSAAYMATYGRPETVMSQRPFTDRSTTPLHSVYHDNQSPFGDDLRESVDSHNLAGVISYNGPRRNISPKTYSPTR